MSFPRSTRKQTVSSPNDIKDINKYKNYFYELEILLVIGNQPEPIDLVQYCSRVQIESQFDDAQFPVVEIDLNTPRDILNKLQQHYNNSLINIKIFKKESVDYNKYNNKRMCMRATQFQILGLDDHHPVPEELKYSDDLSESSTSNARLYPITLHLLDKEHLLMHRTNINNVFNDISVYDLYRSLFQIYSKKQLIIKRPDISQTYENILIPPMNVSKVVYYIQKMFGAYSNGIRYFQDFQFTWLMGRDQTIQRPGNHFEKLFVECIDITQNDGDTPTQTWNDGDTRTHFVRTAINPIIQYNDTTNRDLGDNISFDGTQQSNDSSPSSGTATANLPNNLQKTKDTHQWNSLQHSNNVKEHLRQKNESLVDINVTLPDSDIENYTLDKQVTVQAMGANNKRYKHSCRIKTAIIQFAKTDGETTWKSISNLHLIPK